jgi:hypothetical protein
MSQKFSMTSVRTSVKFSAIVLAAALALTPVSALATNNDLDGDSVNDKIDNCIPRSETASDLLSARNPRANGVQADTDGDGFGNRCDCDYDNNGIVGYSDFGIFSIVAGAVDQSRHPGEPTTVAWTDVFDANGTAVTPEMVDHNADGRVNQEDLDDLLNGFGYSPGPSNAK